MSLKNILVPLSLERFSAEYWGEKPLHVKRDEPDFYDSIFNLNEIDRCFQDKQLPAHFFRVAKAGEQYRPEQWAYLETRRDFNAIHLVDRAKLFALYAQGASIIMGSAEEKFPKLAEFCNNLQLETQFRVQANVYMTPENSQGLDRHFDTHDVFILQISGRKTWQLFDTPIKSPVLEQSFVSQELKDSLLSKKVELYAGDALYVPRGLVHQACTDDHSSTHITLGLHNKRALDVFDLLKKRAINDQNFRVSVPLNGTTKEHKEHFFKHLSEKLRQMIDDTDLNELFSEEQASFCNDVFNVRHGHYSSLLALSQLSSQSVVSRIESARVSLQNIEDKIEISSNNQSFSFPSYLLPAVEQAIGFSKPFKVNEVKGLLTESGKLHLIKQLIQLGLLKIEAE